jgi:hypothetical protein
MALAIDASSPVRFNMADPGIGDDPSGTSASFTPPSGSLLVVSAVVDTGAGVTPSATCSGGGLTFTEDMSRGDSEGTAGICKQWTAPVPTGASMTVTVAFSNVGVIHGAATVCGSGKVWVETGQDASPKGATAENSSTTNNWSPAGPTTTAANSHVFATGSEWNALGSPVSSDLTEDAFSNSFISGLHGYKLVASAGATTLNFDASGSSAADWNMISQEIKEAAGGGGAAFLVPPRRRSRNLYRM